MGAAREDAAGCSTPHQSTGLGLTLVGVMAWLERRPRKSLNPRMVPTTPLMFLGAFICLVAVIHIVNSFGIHTGKRWDI